MVDVNVMFVGCMRYMSVLVTSGVRIRRTFVMVLVVGSNR